MGTISIVFRLPIVDVTTPDADRFAAFRCCDYRTTGDGQRIDVGRARPCGHRHSSRVAVRRCARAMSLGSDFAATGERVEIRGVP